MSTPDPPLPSLAKRPPPNGAAAGPEPKPPVSKPGLATDAGSELEPESESDDEGARALLGKLNKVAAPPDLSSRVPALIQRRSAGRFFAKRRLAAGLTSGGEQQMTAIGRALMTRPRLMLLDEPSMGLAPLVTEDIFQALDHLCREEGLSLLLAEQNAALSLRHAARAYVLENGRAVLEGEAAELRRRDDIQAFYLGMPPPQAGAGAEPALATG